MTLRDRKREKSPRYASVQRSPTGQSKIGVLRVEHAWFGGEGRIRTYGPVGRTAAIRLLRLQPLSHLSVMVNDGQ
jgi:hypothetical protein